MFALLRFFLALFSSLFKSKSRLEAENAALRRQLLVLQRKVRGRVGFTNSDRLFLIPVPTANPTLVTIACESADYRCDEGLVQLDLVRSGRPVPVAGGAASRNPVPATSAQCVAA
jgi:hypothetical protein